MEKKNVLQNLAKIVMCNFPNLIDDEGEKFGDKGEGLRDEGKGVRDEGRELRGKEGEIREEG